MKKKKKLTLKAIRINMGNSQEEQAILYGVSKDTVSNWERFETYPDVRDVAKIEKSTGYRYDDIIFLPSEYGETVTNEEKNGGTM